MTRRREAGRGHFILFVAIAMNCAIMVGCGRSSEVVDRAPADSTPVPENPNQNEPETGAGPTPQPPHETPQPPSSDPVIAIAPLWEKSAHGQRAWSIHAYKVIEAHGLKMLAGPRDVKEFCPKYFEQSRIMKINFWVYLISAMVKYESGFNPLSRMKEVGLGIDPVTGQQVYSEGLLQLSYQDALAYKFCDEFDWASDSRFAANDPRRSILDPYKNLSCGIRILETIVTKKSAISFKSGHYWSVLMTGSKYSKVNEIKALTRSIAACR